MLLTVAILATPFHYAFPQESQNRDLPFLLDNLESRKLLRDFNQLKDTAQALFKSAEEEKAIEAFYALKAFTQNVLNVPVLNWDTVGLEFQVSQLEDALIKDVQGFDPIPTEERIFLDPALSESDIPTLFEKEKIFLGFEDVRKEFDKLKMIFHWTMPLASYVTVNFVGKRDFERFVSVGRYTVMPDEKFSGAYEIIPKLSDLQALELEALAQDQSEEGWKKVLKRVAIDLHLAEWVTLDLLWIASLHPPSERLSVLPLSCQGQYQTLPPLTIPHLLAEKEKVDSRALFEVQFYTMLRTDKIFQIPVLASESFVRKLLERVPSWRQEQEGWMAQDPQSAKAQVQRTLHFIQGIENRFTVYAISWYFQSQNQIPFEWEGAREELELKILSQLVATKKILLLAILERLLWDSKASVNSEVKRQIVALVEEASVPFLEDETLKSASHRIYELYEEAKTTVQEVKQDLLRQANPSLWVKDQLNGYLELTQKIMAQDQKITHLKGGAVFPPLEDTPENFKIASLIFSPQLIEAISKESFDEIEKVLFEEGSTYEAAFDRYHTWFPSFEGDKKIKEDMEKIASVMGFTRTRHLSDMFKESSQRISFEEAARGLFILQEPLLGTEVTYGGTSKPLYDHFSQALQQNRSQDVFVELAQRAVWVKKQLVEYEMDRFCRLNPTTPQGLEFLLSNTAFRKLALLKFPGFEALNEKIMAELHEEFFEGKFEQAIGYGFLTIIGFSFVSGPLRRLPWWLGGHLAKALPHALLKSGHIFGTAAAPFAIWWMGKHAKHYFWQEEHVVESLENWSEFHIQGRKEGAVTILDVLKEEATISKDSAQGFRHHPDILNNKLELRVAQTGFILFAPVQYAFVRGMLSQSYRFYSQSLPFTRRVGITAALKKLYIPTRFLTFRPGNELLVLPPEALRRAYLDAVDRSISVPKLRAYSETWTRLLTRELAEHEAKWGVGATWQETVRRIETKAAKTWVSGHATHTFYFTTRQSLAQKLIVERQMLVIRARLNQEALAQLKNQKVSKVSELVFRPHFTRAVEELEMYFDQNLARVYPPDELAWLMTNVDSSRFVGIWFGNWVGIRGSLGYALDKLAAYQYLSSQRLPLFFSVLR